MTFTAQEREYLAAHVPLSASVLPCAWSSARCVSLTNGIAWSTTRYMFPNVLAAVLAVAARQTFDLGAQALQTRRELTCRVLGILAIRHTATLARAWLSTDPLHAI